MKAYSVKQVAEMLDTNPETIRRWIRNGKMHAVQVSRKDGNRISEEALKKFLEVYPKYLSKITVATMVSPAVSIGTLAGGLLATAIIAYYGTQKQTVTRIKSDDFKTFLAARRDKVKELISQREAQKKEIEKEIEELQSQLAQYQYLLEHEDLVKKTIEIAELNRN